MVGVGFASGTRRRAGQAVPRSSIRKQSRGACVDALASLEEVGSARHRLAVSAHSRTRAREAGSRTGSADTVQRVKASRASRHASAVLEAP